jgi:hypothetical protein
LSLPVLVFLTPTDFEVQIIDECFKNVSLHDPAGQVGICLTAPQTPRAYRMGDGFKEREEEVEEKTDTTAWRIPIQFALEGGVLLNVNFGRRPNFLGWMSVSASRRGGARNKARQCQGNLFC